MKKPLNERMEDAGLHELMPDFDKAAEWNKLEAKLHPTAPYAMPVWKIAATILLLIFVGGAALMIVKQDTNEADRGYATNTSMHTSWAYGVLPPIPEQPRQIAVKSIPDHITVKSAAKASNSKVPADTNNAIQGICRTGEFVCNSTPCPIEICITQIMKCGNGNSSAITSCSVVDPDQARQMRFKTTQNTSKNCNVEIDEIRIKRVATGETIVLNSHSQPSTAQELFDCLTGNMDCSLMAGIFKNDCNNERRPGKLKVESDAGSLILE